MPLFAGGELTNLVIQNEVVGDFNLRIRMMNWVSALESGNSSKPPKLTGKIVNMFSLKWMIQHTKYRHSFYVSLNIASIPCVGSRNQYLFV